MTDARDALISICESIELEMRRLEIWAAQPPGPAALNSGEPFCHDTLGFAEWLQWVFLPRVREVVHGKRDMPRNSNIYAYAEEVLKNSRHEADQLLFLIATFDELVETASAQA